MDLRSIVRARIGRGLDTIFPLACRLCAEPTRSTLALCAVCRGELQPNRACCRCCAVPLLQPGVCPQCLDAPPRLQRVVAPFIYEEGIAFLISRWKYHGEQELGPTLARLWLDEVHDVPAADLLLPVPLHWRRLLARGFNQSADLAEALGAMLGRRYAPGGYLRRVRATPAQAQADRRQRLANLRGAFTVGAPVEGLRIALIDDVCTTGATGESAATVLLAAGARSVQLWCLARTPPQAAALFARSTLAR